MFLKNSKEAIWQLQPVVSGNNTFDAQTLVLVGEPNNYPQAYALRSTLYANFEPKDKRKINWVDSVITGSGTFYYSYKYKISTSPAPVTEYLMVLRLAEQYLIRAEARAKQNKLGDAVADLNIIRNRAGLLNTTAITQADILAAIYHERQVELFLEWGHRWFDLKRTGLVDAVLGSEKPGWKSTNAFYPIPFSDIQINSNLVQNPGYQ